MAAEALAAGGCESVINLMGATSFQDSLALIHGAKALIGGDSAPMHLAGFTNTPCLNLSFGNVNFWETGPRSPGRRSTTPCVLDFSRHMNQVLEVNAEERWARVQPGVGQDELNHQVRPLGLLFGPDTSTSNRATLGGMIGNNSGGTHSIAYGLTVEHVIGLRAILADGSEVVFGEVTPEAFRAKCALADARNDIPYVIFLS